MSCFIEKNCIRSKEVHMNSSSDKVSFFNKSYLRRIKWLLFNSGVVSLGIEHFLAMFPATILFPIFINKETGLDIIDISMVLLTSGIGTIAFTIFSKGKIPAYLGSSFAYISFTMYLMETHTSNGVSPDTAFVYVGWAYLFSGIILVILSLLYKRKGVEKALSFLLPPTVIGPAISLIGLELSDNAMADSGFDITEGIVDSNAVFIAVTTLFVIIIFSVIKHKILKNAAIIIGMIVGCVLYALTNDVPDFQSTLTELKKDFFSIPEFHIPLLSVPPNLPGLFISVLPATLIVYTENIGRSMVIDRMVNDNPQETSIFNRSSIETYEKALFSHGIATMISALIGSVPNTMYAENIAVMSIHKSKVKKDPDKFIEMLTNQFSWIPYIIAAIIAILFSFFGFLRFFMENVPKPVIGGMELFLFGIISAPGIQLLVEQRVNYKKISNQLITAAVLITGVSGIEVNYGVVELKGMSLGFIIGILLNLLVQFLKWFGNISDPVTFSELLAVCLESLQKKSDVSENGIIIRDMQTAAEYIKSESDRTQQNAGDLRDDGLEWKNVQIEDVYKLITGTISELSINNQNITSVFMKDYIEHITYVEIGTVQSKMIILRKTTNGLFIEFLRPLLHKDVVDIYVNDYPEAIDKDDNNAELNQRYMRIDMERSIPIRKISELIGLIQFNPCQDIQQENTSRL